MRPFRALNAVGLRMIVLEASVQSQMVLHLSQRRAPLIVLHCVLAKLCNFDLIPPGETLLL